MADQPDLGLTPTPDTGERLSPVRLWDEAPARPARPPRLARATPPGAVPSPAISSRSTTTCASELAQVRDLIRQVRDGAVTAAGARSAINDMTHAAERLDAGCVLRLVLPVRHRASQPGGRGGLSRTCGQQRTGLAPVHRPAVRRAQDHPPGADRPGPRRWSSTCATLTDFDRTAAGGGHPDRHAAVAPGLRGGPAGRAARPARLLPRPAVTVAAGGAASQRR